MDTALTRYVTVALLRPERKFWYRWEELVPLEARVGFSDNTVHTIVEFKYRHEFYEARVRRVSHHGVELAVGQETGCVYRAIFGQSGTASLDLQRRFAAFARALVTEIRRTPMRYRTRSRLRHLQVVTAALGFVEVALVKHMQALLEEPDYRGVDVDVLAAVV